MAIGARSSVAVVFVVAAAEGIGADGVAVDVQWNVNIAAATVTCVRRILSLRRENTLVAHGIS